MKLSVVIPCYTEEKNITRIPSEVVPVLASLGMEYEIVIVDDGSKDNSVFEAKKLLGPTIRLVEHPVNKGLGAALRTGIGAATGDLLVFLDSDLTFHPSLIPNLLTAMRKHPDVDFVIGSPYLGSFGAGIPKWRLWVSNLANAVYGLLLGKRCSSINPIFRLYKTSQLKELPLEAMGFEINAEILFKLVFRKRRFIEIPATLTQREFGVSKLNYGREARRHAILIFKILKWKLFGF